ncbi:uncharacterized protein E5676_scaffold232G00840 [Cucumis melo var. makuwa]|uniref:CACTA en-spm transposon protein n=1 Tax=Cucumis melo var. makuwa TaxID=1194695 RepID=A0A5D3BF38_CUCMM|nr:uncharacterized protein E5676_scaffold232G00840 [Cucumis melo var. makuwa]
MRWHRDKRAEIDDVLRHSTNAEGWKHFDCEFSDFSSDPRNMHLGLASDRFNPFGQMSTSYSMWPVALIPYNIPPWKCMKKTNFSMSLLIPGPRSIGRKIDVYLQPLIEELKELWDFEVRTYDPLTRWRMKGYQACPICMGDRSSFRLQGRISFIGHRCYLSENHVWCRSKLHNGKVAGTVAYSWMYPIERSLRTLIDTLKLLNHLRLLGDVHSLNSWSWRGTQTLKENTSRSSRATYRFVEHQMLTSLKEFKGDCYSHFKKYNDPKEARVNPSHILVGCMEDWYFLCDHYMSRAFQSNHGRTKLLDKNKLTIIEVGRSHFYNDNTNSLNNEVSQSTMWSYLGKHTFELAHSYFRSLRMRIEKGHDLKFNCSSVIPYDLIPQHTTWNSFMCLCNVEWLLSQVRSSKVLKSTLRLNHVLNFFLLMFFLECAFCMDFLLRSSSLSTVPSSSRFLSSKL